MKKTICLLLALALTLLCCAVSLAENPEDASGAFVFPYQGFRFDPPEMYRNTKGIMVLEGPVDLSKTIHAFSCGYYAMTEENYALYVNGQEDAVPENERLTDALFYVFCFDDGMTFSEFNALVENSFDETHVRELGKAGNIVSYLYMEGRNQNFIRDIDPSYLEEYLAMADAEEAVAAAFTFFEPEKMPDPNAAMVGTQIVFDTTDLDGNPVSSADLFAQNEITMVNIWTTWCGPCVAEMPELEAIYQSMRDKGVCVVGMMADTDVKSARKLLAQKGVTYPIIMAPDTLYDFFPLEGYPSTLFIGRDGTVLALPVVGAYIEKYKTVLNELTAEK